MLGLIGAGGMGEVYKARDTRLDRTVALKVLPQELSLEPARRARFDREAQTISALTHPHICTLFDVGEQDGQAFLVMEHLAGETLAQRLKKGPLPLVQALELAAQVAEALAAAHKQGIVHRDLKPGNLMLTKGGVKLLDFGLAKLKGHGEQPALASVTSAPTASAPLTERGAILGTLQYMAPEQLEGKPADARTDLWALGAVLYEMLTGKHAFEGHSSASLVGAIMAADPAPLASLQPLTPPSLGHLVSRCLEKDPDHRWDSAHDVADELRWISQAELVATAGTRTPEHLPRRRLNRAAVAALALLALAASGGALWRAGLWRRFGALAQRSGITSVAVLPLQNLSADPSQEYFADGLTDALISELGQIRALRVISRTSVMRYKGSRKPVPEIARELNGVGAIVEGTIQREADRVAITVQLINAISDEQIWSKSYERDLSDILALRKEIAQTVAREIRAAVTPEEQHRLLRKERVNPEAFDHYLQVLDLRSRGDTADNARARLEHARKAVKLDPRFPEAHAALADASARLWWYHWDRRPERVSEAWSAANKALELDPRLPEAHRAKGAIHYFFELDYEAALREFSSALERSPSDSDSLAFVAYVRRRQGKLDETVRYLRKALDISPLDAALLFNLGETYALLRQPEAAERAYDQALKLNPVFNRPLAYKLRWRLRVRPELVEAREVERQAEAAGLGTDPLVLYHRVLLRFYAGEHAHALDLLTRGRTDVFEESFWFVPRALLEGQLYDRIGQRARARERYGAARRVAEDRLRVDSTDTRCRSALGLALAGLGDRAAAIREGKAAVDAMPVAQEAYRGAYRLEDLARIYAAVGERDLAVEIITQLLSLPDDLAAPALILEPAWASLRGHPGFDRLVATGR